MQQKQSSMPSFYVMGTQKAATTTVNSWLKLHKNISLPYTKETHFFSKNEIYHKGLGWYLNQFEPKNKYSIRGEVDPSYMYINTVFDRFKDHYINHNIKFIFILRHPLERAFSHYLMSFNRGVEDLSFVDALYNESYRIFDSNNLLDDVKDFSYRDRGNYYNQIYKYLDYFKDSEFLFLKFDDIIIKPKNIYNKICKFLDILELDNMDFSKKNNPASMSRYTFVSNLLNKNNIYKNLFNKIVKSEKIKFYLKNKINNMNNIKISVKDKDLRFKNILKTLPQEFIDWNNNEVKKVSRIVDIDLDNWFINNI